MPSPLSVPADRVAPSGTPEIVTVRVSELSVRPELISSAIALSSEPLASDVSSAGASATPATSTVIEPEVVATSSPSADCAVTSRSNEPLKSSAGVIVSPSRSADDRVHVPSPLFVPADKVAPSGTPETVTVRTSELSVRPALISSVIALSSEPLASDVFNVGASATPATTTVIDPLVVATSPPSADCAVTPMSNEPLKSSAGVIVKPSRSPDDKVHVPSLLSVPAERVAPSGTPEIVTVRVSLESVRPASISSAIAESSLPDASATSSVGISATPATSTVIEPLVVATSSPSAD